MTRGPWLKLCYIFHSVAICCSNERLWEGTVHFQRPDIPEDRRLRAGLDPQAAWMAAWCLFGLFVVVGCDDPDVPRPRRRPVPMPAQVLGVVLVPDGVDAQGGTYDAEEIRKTERLFLSRRLIWAPRPPTGPMEILLHLAIIPHNFRGPEATPLARLGDLVAYRADAWADRRFVEVVEVTRARASLALPPLRGAWDAPMAMSVMTMALAPVMWRIEPGAAARRQLARAERGPGRRRALRMPPIPRVEVRVFMPPKLEPGNPMASACLHRAVQAVISQAIRASS